MKIKACCKNYSINDDSGVDSPTLSIQLAAPGGSRYVEIDCIFDTGSDTSLSIPIALVGPLKDLGLEFPNRGTEIASTANGDASSIVSSADISLACLNGRPITFFGARITLDRALDVPLIGMGLLRFFNIRMIDGEVRNFEFNDKYFR